MGKRMVLYRGSLKSCNYRCSYCPFSKHRGSGKELARDREQWLRFCRSLSERAGKEKIGGLMVVPYGEALIHPWYWEGLGSLTASDAIEAAGAQTNGSFSIKDSLERFAQAGGKREKLRLWITFHPEMTTPDRFAEGCRLLRKEGILVSAGAVGVPGHLDLLLRLRNLLPEEIYLWINKMDGLRRPYRAEEIRQFLTIDPYFYRELRPVLPEEHQCGDRVFVEADGMLRRCNIGPALGSSWYDSGDLGKGAFHEVAPCRRKLCSCYLAYGGRDEVMNRVLFGDYPLFRIPQRKKAVFLDVDGTLIPSGKGEISPYRSEDLKALAAEGKTRLFFATTLPYEEARKRCGKVWHLFAGGVFAAGAHVVLGLQEKKRECFLYLEEEAKNRWLSVLEQEKEWGHFRILTYESGEELSGNGAYKRTYKITLVRPKHRRWEDHEVRALEARLRQAETEMKGGKEREAAFRCFGEEHCLQIVASGATKAEGVKCLCSWLEIPIGEIWAEGDSREDEEMMALHEKEEAFQPGHEMEG